MFGKDKRPPLAALALLVLVGCAGRMENPVTEPPAMAPKATMEHGGMQAGQPAATLKPDALDAPAATSVADAQRSVEIAEEMSGAGDSGHEGHGGHGGGTGTYVHTDAGREMAAPEESHDHHGHGMAEHGMAEDKEAAEVYACPMHPEVTSPTPGKCPKCGMDLAKRRQE